MRAVDLKSRLRELYSPTAGRPVVVDVPELSMLTVDGDLEPGSPPGESAGFQAAVGALYGAAYTLKFTFKKRADDPVDFPVMPLEGLWWVEDGVFDLADPSNWQWRVLIVVPEEITRPDLDQALAQVRRKRGDDPALAKVQLRRWREGRCVQVMHVGPYSGEPTTMAVLADWITTHGYVDQVGRGGRHHEIYLGDPRRADPARLRTILRHPVASA